MLYSFIIDLPFFAFSIVFYAIKGKMSQKVEKEKRLAPFVILSKNTTSPVL